MDPEFPDPESANYGSRGLAFSPLSLGLISLATVLAVCTLEHASSVGCQSFSEEEVKNFPVGRKLENHCANVKVELIQESIWPILDEKYYFHPKGWELGRRIPVKKHTNKHVQRPRCSGDSFRASIAAVSSPLFASLDHLPGGLLSVSGQTQPKHEVNEPCGRVEFQAKLTSGIIKWKGVVEIMKTFTWKTKKPGGGGGHTQREGSKVKKKKQTWRSDNHQPP